MSAQRYQKLLYVDAIQFQGADAAHIAEIIAFTGLSISIDYSSSGAVTLRVIRGTYDVVVAGVGDYLVKDDTGKLTKMIEAEFSAEYQPLVESGEGAE
ncbi:hypothetical protein [Cohnella algarum]|uniref:hypothetical protein n=1 Tax=Cohnella algarum TaxID=2044859 RepID=UPI0019672EE9|nr:hypothetical protein [Cohnella algarum]MBN2980127.1 hypothetical protein [Cohnella algarum]